MASCYFFNSSYDVFKLSFFSLQRAISRLSALISTDETLFALSKADSRLVHFSWNIRTLSVSVFSVEMTRLKSWQTRLTCDSRSLFVVSNYCISRVGWVSISALNWSTSNLTVSKSSIFLVFWNSENSDCTNYSALSNCYNCVTVRSFSFYWSRLAFWAISNWRCFSSMVFWALLSSTRSLASSLAS